MAAEQVGERAILVWVFFAYKKILGRTETRTRDRICFQMIRPVRDISRDDRARIATCRLRTATDRCKANYSVDYLYINLRRSRDGASVHACMRASVRPCVRASVRPCVRASVRPCVRASVRPCVRASVRPCVRASVRPCVRASVRPCARAPVRPCVRAFVSSCVRAFVCHSFALASFYANCPHKGII